MVNDIGRPGGNPFDRRCHRAVYSGARGLSSAGSVERGRESTPSRGNDRHGRTTRAESIPVLRHAQAAVDRGTLLLSETLRDLRGEETVVGQNRRHLDAAVKWIFTAQDATETAGCASAYNLVLGWGGPYPETTGYIIPTLYEYAEQRKRSEPQRRAAEMAEWLLTRQFDDGSFPAGDDPTNETEPSIFNTGQIVFGLARAHREIGEQRFVDAVRRAGAWLADVQHEDGYWDQYDYNDVVHSYSARVGWALADAYHLTGVERLREAAINNLRWVVKQRRPNGWFDKCGFEADEDPFLHTIAYTIRGLFEGGCLLDDDELVREAQTSADAFLELQMKQGVLRGRYDRELNPSAFYCLTGNAQMAIIWYRLFEETGEQRYRQGADETVAFLKTRQRMDGPPQVRGGLKGSDPVWGRYMYLRYPNWAAKFLADALLLAKRLPSA